MNMPSVQVDNKFTAVYLDNMTLWFSYSTLIAFRVGSTKVVHENVWSKTTGKHLNQVDNGDKANRVGDDTFKKKWDELTANAPSPILG